MGARLLPDSTSPSARIDLACRRPMMTDTIVITSSVSTIGLAI